MTNFFQEQFPFAFKSPTGKRESMANDGQFDLKEEILKLKKDFDVKFGKTESSTSGENLKSFTYLTILGQGAFGVVVID